MSPVQMHNPFHHVIASLIPPGSRVLDLGCGDGALLALLRDARQCTGYGIELDDAKVEACVARGVNVIQRNLEEGLSIFDGAFIRVDADRFIERPGQRQRNAARAAVSFSLAMAWGSTPSLRQAMSISSTEGGVLRYSTT